MRRQFLYNTKSLRHSAVDTSDDEYENFGPQHVNGNTPSSYEASTQTPDINVFRTQTYIPMMRTKRGLRDYPSTTGSPHKKAKTVPKLLPIKEKYSFLSNPFKWRKEKKPKVAARHIEKSVSDFQEKKSGCDSGAGSSFLSKVFNFGSRHDYLGLLSKLVPNLYDITTTKNDSRFSPEATKNDSKSFAQNGEVPTVDPVNSFKEKLDLNPRFQPNWLEKFLKQHEQRVKSQQKQIEEVEKEVLELSMETEVHEKSLTERLKNYALNSKVVIIDDEDLICSETETEFPELDLDILQQIYVGNPHQVIISKFGLNITRHDLHTLVGSNWLNDEVINFYMNLLIERGQQRSSEGYPRVHAMNTFFLTRLSQSGYSGVRRWTRKVDLFACDLVLVPVHVGGVHWCMAIINLRDEVIQYYDSMGSPNHEVLNMLAKYIQDEYQDKKGRPLDMTEFVRENMRDIPQQTNGSDCGVFSCMFAEYVSRNRRITFSQQNMPYFREKMILEIAQGQLMN